MQYKGFTLDPFQEDAISAIDAGDSVVVSAATGTGKTLIADYIINEAIEKGWHVIYTAPIKALSNQKFRDFKAEYGDKVGLLTGDVVINPEAPIRIMTTEIYRNMLVAKEPFRQLRYVIFDEIHFINDPERGTVWEESIIFSPEHVRFLCLSATIPNYRQFADWIATIKEHQVDTVSYTKRAVPLSQYYYDAHQGVIDHDRLKEALENQQYPRSRKRGRHGRQRGRGQDRRPQGPDHRELIRELEAKDWLPAIFFFFSRKATLEKAQECARKFDLTTHEEKTKIIEIFNRIVTGDVRQMHSTRAMKELVLRGVGVHNAGVLPKLKEVVEVLFGEGLLKVLYATETFAVGINMPARTVAFGGIQKYDGRSFRYLNSKEYFQLAGRAGRRGIDKVGYVVVMLDAAKMDYHGIEKTVDKDMEPIVSQFTLSYNMVLNLMKNYMEDERMKVLESNFGYFVKRQSTMQMRIRTSFANYLRTLQKLGFINGDTLTWKGRFATYIYTKELAVSSLVFDEHFMDLNDEQLTLVIMAMIYESKPSQTFKIKGANVGHIIRTIKQNRELDKAVSIHALKRLYWVVTLWMRGHDFEELLDICNLDEGDIIRLFRQTLDMMSQIKHALHETGHYQELIKRLDDCEERIDRDIVAVEF